MIKNSHIVIKLEWLNNLNETERQIFMHLIDKATANIEPHEYYIEEIDKIITIKKELEDIIYSTLKIEYNGQYCDTYSGLPIDLTPAHRGSDRELQDNTIDEIIFRKLYPELEKNQYTILGLEYKDFKHPTALQMVWLIEKENQMYVLGILIKWDCSNHYAIEVHIEPLHKVQLTSWAMRGLLEHFCNWNYSKIVGDFTYKPTPESNRLRMAFTTNEV